MYVTKEKYEHIFNLLPKTECLFTLGAFLQCTRWEWVSGMETEICPKGSIRGTKEDRQTVPHTKKYVYFNCTLTESLVHDICLENDYMRGLLVCKKSFKALKFGSDQCLILSVICKMSTMLQVVQKVIENSLWRKTG